MFIKLTIKNPDHITILHNFATEIAFGSLPKVASKLGTLEKAHDLNNKSFRLTQLLNTPYRLATRDDINDLKKLVQYGWELYCDKIKPNRPAYDTEKMKKEIQILPIKSIPDEYRGGNKIIIIPQAYMSTTLRI